MRLHVSHRTLYRFNAPMRWITQSHRLTPSVCASQRTLDWRITVEGAETGGSFVDGAGDRISTMTLAGPVERVEVRVEGSVETTDTAGILRDHREIVSPRVYLVATEATEPSPALHALMSAALEGAGDDGPLARSHRLAAAVAEAIAYAPGTTEAHTSAAEALERGEGVCQDHAHALIAVAHAAGMPARYVAGYLLTEGDGGLEEASHAWAELYVPSLGWIGFDAANRCCPDERYIRLGSGRDAHEAAPIRGVSRGGGVEEMEVSVVVSEAPASSQSQSQSQTQQ
ncbi:MAG: transglutaminase family protein [Rhodobacteraceae bacterium]|nr:transglutaminase family protein [Paracoccaceae bacterium]